MLYIKECIVKTVVNTVKYRRIGAAVRTVIAGGLMVLLSVAVSEAEVRGSASLGIRMKPVLRPPESVMDLHARPGDTYGVIQITWTAVADFYGNRLQSDFVYRVLVSLEDPSDPMFSDNNHWWDTAQIVKSVDISEAEEPGDPEEKEITGLEPGSTYYVGIKAHVRGEWSEDLNASGVRTLDMPYPPAWAVIDSFENDGSRKDEKYAPDAGWRSSGDRVFRKYSVSSSESFNGEYSLQVEYNKSGVEYAYLAAGSLYTGSNNISDFSVSGSKSVSLQGYPLDRPLTIMVRLLDADGNLSDPIGQQTAGTLDQWQRLDWSWEGTDTGNIDITRIEEVRLYFAPGVTEEAGRVYIDDLKLNDVGDDVRNVLAVSSENDLRIDLYWPAAGSDLGILHTYRIYRATHSFSSVEEPGVSLVKSTSALSWSDTTVPYWDAEYFYSVVAEDERGVRTPATPAVSTKTAVTPAPVLISPGDGYAESSLDVELGWEYPEGLAEWYEIVVFADAGLQDAVKSVDAGLSTGAVVEVPGEGVYYWSVRARFTEGRYSDWALNGPWKIIADTTPPEDITVSAVEIRSVNVDLAVTASDTLSGLDDSPYLYAKSLTGDTGSAWSYKGWVSSPTLTWGGLEPGTTYYFRCAARDRAGNTAWSDEIIKVVTSGEKLYIDREYYREFLDEVTGRVISRITVSEDAYNFLTRLEIRKLTPEQEALVEEADRALEPGGRRGVVELRDYAVLDEFENRVTGATEYPGGITVRFNYPDSLTRPDERNLRIVRLNESSGEWEKAEDFELNMEERWIQTRVSGLSVYGLAVYPYDTLEDVYVYPNPFKPGDDFYGSAHGASGGIIIGNLPSRADIRIFNVAGELVDRFTHRGGNWASWAKAEEVASGVYILIVNHNGESKTVRFSVIR